MVILLQIPHTSEGGSELAPRGSGGKVLTLDLFSA